VSRAPGKTAALEVVRRAFWEQLLVLPEAATMLFAEGSRGTIPMLGSARRRDAIFHVQRAMEKMVGEEQRVAVAFCDRGTLDRLAYTSAETALMGGMMWLGVGHMCHHGSSGCGDWSDMERNTMIGLVAGYVVVKIASGVQAASAAGDFKRAHAVPRLEPVVVPTTGGVVLGLTLRL
jgi:hypothetical protein